jgi:hypothetical protein
MITGTTVYPNAGMLIMFNEAIHPTAIKENRKLRALESMNIHFKRELVIPSDGAVETLLSIRLKAEPSDGFHSFTVS